MGRLRKFARHLFSRTDPEEYHRILQKHNSYFRELNEINKGKFVRRCDEFLHSVSFGSEPGFRIEFEMKVIVSSAFIQITFGLKEYILREYDHIFIAPRSYIYPGHDKLMSGDVNTALKQVSLSWPAVLKGFEIEDDALNIAIHEFGHCLTIENFSRPYMGAFFTETDWLAWIDDAREKMQTIRAGKSKVIRQYGGTDLMELFAVSLESYFEKPDSMKQRLPEMYDSLKKILNQEPMNREDPVCKK